MNFFKRNLTDFLIFVWIPCLSMRSLKKWFKLKKTSVKTLLNDHAQLKNKTKLKKTNVETLLK